VEVDGSVDGRVVLYRLLRSGVVLGVLVQEDEIVDGPPLFWSMYRRWGPLGWAELVVKLKRDGWRVETLSKPTKETRE
jgi:hypothetical protein